MDEEERDGSNYSKVICMKVILGVKYPYNYEEFVI